MRSQRMLSLKRRIAILMPWLVMLVFGGLISGSMARAYNNEGSLACGFPYGGSGVLSITIRDDYSWGPTGNYVDAYNNSQTLWNQGYHPAAVSYNSGSPHYRAVTPEGSGGVRGHAERSCSGGYRTTTIITVNSLHPDPASSYQWRQSAAAHKLGHSIWASHSYYSAIMNPSRDISFWWPLRDDGCAIQQRYPSSTWPTFQCGY